LQKVVITKGVKVLYFDTLLQVFFPGDLRPFSCYFFITRVRTPNCAHWTESCDPWAHFSTL
jgi:hypothetical protein